jgi:hypothetical protein
VWSEGKPTGERRGRALHRQQLQTEARGFPGSAGKTGKKINSTAKSVAAMSTILFRSNTYEPVSRFDQTGILLLSNREPKSISGK